jgi:hypothetical protein
MIRIRGIVRLPSDPESGVDSVIQIMNDRLSLRSGRTDLGSWPLAHVEVQRISNEAFRFNIDHEVLLFLPRDPEFFASLQFVEATVQRTAEKRKRKKTKAAIVPPAVEETPVFEEQEAQEELIEVDLTDEEIALGGRGLLARTKYIGAATRDQLRQTGIWPLDRLKPLSAEDSRSSAHVHTYGTSTIQAGLVRRVCSECGHVSFAPKESTPDD